MTKEMQLPGPEGTVWRERDAAVISPSYTRGYPFVMDHASLDLVIVQSPGLYARAELRQMTRGNPELLKIVLDALE